MNLIKRFRSKFGIALSFAYWTLCLLTVIVIFFSAPDGLSILVPLFLTSPWSLLLFGIASACMDYIPESIAPVVGPVSFVLVFIVAAGINTAILYLLGWLFTRSVAPLNRN